MATFVITLFMLFVSGRIKIQSTRVRRNESKIVQVSLYPHRFFTPAIVIIKKPPEEAFNYRTSSWFLKRSSNTSGFLMSFASPSFTSTSAGFKRELKLLDISKP